MKIFGIDPEDYIPIAISLLALAFSIYSAWKQARLSRKQQFEGTFFDLLTSIKDLVNNTGGEIVKTTRIESDYNAYTSHVQKEGPFQGPQYFKKANLALQRRIWMNLSRQILNVSINTLNESERLKFYKDISIVSYDEFFDDHVSELAHYFRFLYNVVKLVDETKLLSKKEKRKFINFVQAQMSSDELALLFFNGIGKYGEKFYKIIERYNLLENIDRERTGGLIDVFHKFYPETKFRFIRLEEAEKRVLQDISTYKQTK